MISKSKTIMIKLCFYKQNKLSVQHYRAEFDFIKKEIPAQVFSCKLCEISHNTFFKENFGQLLLHKHSFSLLSHHDFSPFPKRFHAYFPAEYFLDLICTLVTRVIIIFQALSPKPIFNPVEHLRWSFSAKIVNRLKPFSIFA